MKLITTPWPFLLINKLWSNEIVFFTNYTLCIELFVPHTKFLPSISSFSMSFHAKNRRKDYYLIFYCYGCGDLLKLALKNGDTTDVMFGAFWF